MDAGIHLKFFFLKLDAVGFEVGHRCCREPEVEYPTNKTTFSCKIYVYKGMTTQAYRMRRGAIAFILPHTDTGTQVLFDSILYTTLYIQAPP